MLSGIRPNHAPRLQGGVVGRPAPLRKPANSNTNKKRLPMSAFDTPNSNDEAAVSLAQVEELLGERLDVEALAQMVEHLDYADKLSKKLTSAFGEVRAQVGRQGNALGAIQQELRDLLCDVALLKRALASLGHVGVMERRKVERELVRELFPPAQPRPGAGIAVNVSQPKPPQKVDCENRLHLCKAACCRIFNVHLTPPEVDNDIYDWDPRQPYALRKTRHGCIHLTSGGCSCTLYESRPNTCRNYSCAGDKRIWHDFEKMVVNPELAKRLETLSVSTQPPYAGSGARGSVADVEAIAERKSAASSEQQSGASQPQAAGAASAPGDLAVAESRPKVAPPNFDELRKLMVPLPAKRFVPPDRKNGDGEGTHPEGTTA